MEFFESIFIRIKIKLKLIKAQTKKIYLNQLLVQKSNFKIFKKS